MVLMQRSSIVGDEAAWIGFDAVSEDAMCLNRLMVPLVFWDNRSERRSPGLVAAIVVGEIERAPARSW
jgi:hypothetical protein